MKPACYQDHLDGKPIFQKVGGEFVRVAIGRGRFCETIAGKTFFCGWSWENHPIGGSQGHLHVTRYNTIHEYRMYTSGDPALWIED